MGCGTETRWPLYPARWSHGGMTTPSVPTASRVRALARSAPWRFSTLHFTHRRSSGEEVEAWLQRPGLLRVRTAEGRIHVVDHRRPTRTVIGIGERARSRDVPAVLPGDVDVELDDDGFVTHRPDDLLFHADDPIWQSYDWVAMLDPVELSAGTRIDEVAATTRFGRATWWARMTAVDGYEPRCSCCPLLWGEVSERLEADAGGPTWRASRPDGEYPGSWLVGLDPETGVVVSTEPLGGDRDDLGFTVRIHEVDGPVD